jgi:hypothetical protein
VMCRRQLGEAFGGTLADQRSPVQAQRCIEVDLDCNRWSVFFPDLCNGFSVHGLNEAVILCMQKVANYYVLLMEVVAPHDTAARSMLLFPVKEIHKLPRTRSTS